MAGDNSQGHISAWTKSVSNHPKKTQLGKFPHKDHCDQLEVVYSRKKIPFFPGTHLQFHQMVSPQIPGVKQRFLHDSESFTPRFGSSFTCPTSSSLSLLPGVLSISVFVRRGMKVQNSPANSQKNPCGMNCREFSTPGGSPRSWRKILPPQIFNNIWMDTWHQHRSSREEEKPLFLCSQSHFPHTTFTLHLLKAVISS